MFKRLKYKYRRLRRDNMHRHTSMFFVADGLIFMSKIVGYSLLLIPLWLLIKMI